MLYSDLQNAYKEIPISRPFGDNDYQRSLPNGGAFGKDYSTPISNGGRRVSRHELNGLGYLATLGTFLDSYGYQPEWRDLSAIGGYPKGAIVSKIDNNGVRQYVNLEDGNTKEPQFEDALTDASSEENGWKPLFRTKEYNFFPDYDSKELIWEYHVTPSNPLAGKEIAIAEPGWVLVERSIDNWEDALESFTSSEMQVKLMWTNENYVSLAPYAGNALYYHGADAFTIKLMEGQKSSRFYPCSNGITIGGKCSDPIAGITISAYHFRLED